MNSDNGSNAKRGSKQFEKRGEAAKDDLADEAILDGLQDLGDLLMDDEDFDNIADQLGPQSQDGFKMKRAMADDED